MHETVQQGRCLVADSRMIGDNARQGRVANFTHRFVVIHTDHGYWFRHIRPDPLASVKDPLSNGVVAGHDSDGLWQAADPSCEPLLLSFPRRVGTSAEWKAIHLALATGGGQCFLEGLPSLLGPIQLGKAAVAKLPQAAFQEVFGGHSADQLVIDMHQRNMCVGRHTQHVDSGQTCAPDGLGDVLVVESDDEAITPPRFEPGWRGGFQTPRLMIDRPRPVLLHISRDASQNLPPGDQRGLHQQRHVGAFVLSSELSMSHTL